MSCGYRDESDCLDGTCFSRDFPETPYSQILFAINSILDKCIVAAISNYTRRLVCPSKQHRLHVRNSASWRRLMTDDGVFRKSDNSHPDFDHAGERDIPDKGETMQSVALKFLVHFFGDLTQPLHVCGRDEGGNLDKVQFEHRHSVNFHSIWDTDL